MSSFSRLMLELLNRLPSSSRSKVLQAIEEGGVPLVHHSVAPKELMTKGLDYSMLRLAGEGYKPTGLYWADAPEAVDRLTYVPRADGKLSAEDRNPSLDQMVLGVASPKSFITPAIPDYSLHKQAMSKILKDYPKTPLGHLNIGLSSARELIPDIDSRKQALTDVLLRRGGIATLTDVDGISNMREHIQMQPGLVQAYWKNLVKLLGVAPLLGLRNNSNEP